MPGDAPAPVNQLLGTPGGATPNALLGMAQYQQSPTGFAQNQLFQGMMQARTRCGRECSARRARRTRWPRRGQGIQGLGLSPQQVADELQKSEAQFHLLAPILRSQEPVTTSQIINAAGDAVASGSFSAPEAASFLSRLPTTDAPSGGTDQQKSVQLRGVLQTADAWRPSRAGAPERHRAVAWGGAAATLEQRKRHMSGSGTVNPQIPLQAAVAQPQNTLLQQFGQYAQTGNALQQLQQNNLLLQSKRALASAYAQTPINPTTGLPDSNALLTTLQKIPGGALAMPQVIQGLQEQAGRQYGLNQDALTQATNRNTTRSAAHSPPFWRRGTTSA